LFVPVTVADIPVMFGIQVFVVSIQ